MIKVIFFGTPDYVIPILENLYKTYKLVAVVTQPPKLAGRKQLRTFSSVDTWAHKRKIPVITDLRQDFPEANLGVVASYGKIIPQNIIDIFGNGILNIHPSLLPKYRGASPIQAQIINGESETGITIIRMDSKMDHGPILSQLKDEVRDTDTNETLRNRLFERSASFLIELLPNYLGNKIKLKEQNDEEATYTKIIDKDDGYVDLKTASPLEVDRKLRALKPWPGVWTKVDEKRLKIIDAHLEDGKLVLDKVQLEGKKSVSFDEFKRGYPQMKF